jgi:hypothetical protein
MPRRKKRSALGKLVSWLRRGVYIAENDIDWADCPEEIDFGRVSISYSHYTHTRRKNLAYAQKLPIILTY